MKELELELESGQFLDWLRENRVLCEQSADLYNQFMKNACSHLYCKDAVLKREELYNQYIEECAEINENNQQECKNVENKVKADDALNCEKS